MPGGPKTSKGKAASRQNAIRHGLAAKTLLPEIFGRGVIEEAFQDFDTEWRPETPTERHLVRELARHHVALSKIEEIEEASLRRGAHAALGINLCSRDDGPEEKLDAALTGAATTDAIEKVSRYRRPHERGFYRSLAALRAIRERKDSNGEPNQANAPKQSRRHRFKKEADCEAYLLSRFQLGHVP